MKRMALLAVLALLVSACGHSPSAGLIRKYAARNSIASFQVCHDYGCSEASTTSFTEAEWARVRAQFARVAQSAADEREQIRHAIATMETIVGPKTGTDIDGPGAAIINFMRVGQMDCIDEAYNTSVYLTFLAQDGLLRWHDVGVPANRGMVIDRWFHNTATITERATGERYTVDSWFGANGTMPDVVPLWAWLDGWSPEKPG
jgi:hypothetical protein